MNSPMWKWSFFSEEEIELLLKAIDHCLQSYFDNEESYNKVLELKDKILELKKSLGNE